MTAGITVDEKQQEFITNLAKMGPGGKMTIEVPPSIAEKLGIERTQALEDLDQATADAILNNQKEFEKMNVKDIALNQFTETQKSALLLSEIAAMLKVEFARTYRGLGADVDSMIKVSNQAMEKFLSGESSDLDIKGQIDALRNKAGEDAKKQNMSATAVPQQPTNVNTNNQTNTQQNTQSTQQQKTQVDINIKSSNNLTDTLSREIMKDPTMFEDIFNKSSRDYLNPLGK
jgi:hypothetical protein